MLSGAPPSGVTILFAGLSDNPTSFFELGGASLVPLPQHIALPLPTDESGGHSLDVPGGGGPATLYLQEVILGRSSVTNALRVDFLP